MTQDADTDSIEATKGPEGTDWRAEIAPEYRKVAEKFLNPGEVVRSYAELERKLGKAVAIPADTADEAERERFYERLGRPKRVEDYAIELPADLPDVIRPDEAGLQRQRRFLEQAHRAGLTRIQAQAAIDWYYGELAKAHGEAVGSLDDNAAEADAALRSEWGRDYERNVEYGRRAMAQFGDVEAVDRLEAAIGTPQVLRMMARIGRALGEAGAAAGGGALHSGDLRQELTNLMKSDDYWTNRRIQQRVREIHGELYGDRSVVGADGRGV